MPPDPPTTVVSPDWLASAAIVAVAACLLVSTAAWRRFRRGEPLVSHRNHAPVPWHGNDLLVLLVGGVALATALGAALGAKPPVDLKLAGGLLLQAGMGLFAIAWLVARGARATDLGLVEGHLAADTRLALAGVALVVAPLLALAAAVNRLVPYRHDVADFLMADRDAWGVTLVLATAVIAAPVVEELLFRRVLQGWLEKVLPADGGLAAILLSAAAFALAHQGQGLAFVPLFPLGLVLGFIAHRTGSIVPCILLHALFNLVSVAILLGSPPLPTAGGG
ncbi:MAG: CPBP family intramembrane metalloprotease [Planctomycetes bacterium]|nr:CPBP family intramembrane metalloprotease [Planctomycetota bacterium]